MEGSAACRPRDAVGGTALEVPWARKVKVGAKSAPDRAGCADSVGNGCRIARSFGLNWRVISPGEVPEGSEPGPPRFFWSFTPAASVLADARVGSGRVGSTTGCLRFSAPACAERLRPLAAALQGHDGLEIPVALVVVRALAVGDFLDAEALDAVGRCNGPVEHGPLQGLW